MLVLIGSAFWSHPRLELPVFGVPASAYSTGPVLVDTALVRQHLTACSKQSRKINKIKTPSFLPFTIIFRDH